MHLDNYHDQYRGGGGAEILSLKGESLLGIFLSLSAHWRHAGKA